MWVIGALWVVFGTAVSILFYVQGLRIRAEISKVQLAIMDKIGQYHTGQELLAERLRGLEARTQKVEEAVTRIDGRVERLSAQITRLLAQVFNHARARRGDVSKRVEADA
jgi:predicted nuclease with TOPRIM domain